MGLYEKTTTYYQYNEIKDAEPTTVISIPKEQLDEMFTIIDVRTTIKNSLTEEERNAKPMLKISFLKERTEKYYRDEHWRELLLNFICYCLQSELIGFSLTLFKRKITKDGIHQYLEEQLGLYEIYRQKTQKD